MTISVRPSDSALLALQALRQANEQQAARSASLPAPSGGGSQSASVSVSARLADSSAMQAVSTSLNRAASISDVAVGAGQTVAELLATIQQRLAAANDASASSTDVDGDTQALIGRIQDAVQNASFDGVNLLDGSLTSGVQVLAGTDGSSFSLSPQNLSLGGPIVSLQAGSDDGLADLLSQVNSSMAGVSQALATLRGQSSQVSAHSAFVSRLSDALSTGATGNQGAEAARLQALDLQQHLSSGGFSIANQAPQTILSLFRS